MSGTSNVSTSHTAHFAGDINEDDRQKRYQKLLGLQNLMAAPLESDPDEDAALKRDIHQNAMDFVAEQYTELKKAPGMSDINVDHQLAMEGDSVLSGGIAVLYLFMNLLSELADQKYLQMQQKAKVSRDAQDQANAVAEKVADVSKQGAEGKASLPQSVIDYMTDNGILVNGQSIDDYLGAPQQHDNNVQIKLTSEDGKQFAVNHYQGEYTIYGQSGYTKVDQAVAKGEIDGFEGGEEPGSTITVVKDGVTYTGEAPDFNKLSRGDTAKLADIELDKGKLEAVKDSLENTSNRASDFVSQAQLQLQKVMQTYNVTVSLINSMQTMLEEMNKSIASNIR